MKQRNLLLAALTFGMAAMHVDQSMLLTRNSHDYGFSGNSGKSRRGSKLNFTPKAKIKKARRRMVKRSRSINQINRRK